MLLLIRISAWLLMLATTHTLADSSAVLNRDTINVLQSARLIIKSDNIDGTISPDLSVLEHNFSILGTSTSQNVSIINGNQTTEKTWVVEIEPKSPGSFTIPPITVGNDRTRPLRLTVLAEPTAGAGDAADVFVDFTLDKDRVYVQQQTLATIKLYLDVALLDGSLTDPTAENLEARRMGQDKQYQERVNGRNYQVVERQYALFPTASGTITLPAIRFQGIVQARANTAGGNNVFGNLFNQGTRISARSKPLSLKVNPPDKAFEGRTWLPATSLTIEDLSATASTTEAGQPFTIKLKLEATGLSAGQLPDIGFPDTDAFKQYPDKPIRQTQLIEGTIVSSVTQSIAIIGNGKDNIQLPGIKIDWWDIETDSPQVASLPARTINVALPKTDALTANSTQNPQNKASVTPENQESDFALQESNSGSNGLLIVIGVLFCAWFGTFVLLVIEKRKTNQRVPGESQKEARVVAAKKLESHILSACKANDSIKARENLIKWAGRNWPNRRYYGLLDISRDITQRRLRNAIADLHTTSYAESEANWSGQALHSSFQEYLNSGKTHKPDRAASLPALYPGIEEPA